MRLDPVFSCLAPGKAEITPTPARDAFESTAEQVFALRPSGAGDVVKMDHNGIEYGLMAAYAESLQCRDRTVCATSSIINTISILAMSQRYGGAEVLQLPGCWIRQPQCSSKTRRYRSSPEEYRIQ